MNTIKLTKQLLDKFYNEDIQIFEMHYPKGIGHMTLLAYSEYTFDGDYKEEGIKEILKQKREVARISILNGKIGIEVFPKDI